ncbi:hypothetical protein [Brucella intermedia]|uniref:hypothetical protein n=1 Tax=Brucella intermedia TaxID=94625 RepID=UPI00124D1B3F|nr:hypothetical protein [Brucella intermedia]KAB2720322.1 hypothetical protein F9K75_04430 [Brucella intermedia]
MADGYLTNIEATKSWVLRACGWKVRDIQKRFDVDPRRLYDVWEEKEFKGCRYKAMHLFLRLFPGKPIDGLFDKHVPRFQRTLKTDNQLRLPF